MPEVLNLDLSTDRLEELGIAADPDTVLAVNCLLGLCQRHLNISIEDLVNKSGVEELTSGLDTEVTYARRVCAHADKNEEHICNSCSFGVLGSLAVNQASVWADYDQTGFSTGVLYRIAGNDEVIASLSVDINLLDYSEIGLLKSIYLDPSFDGSLSRQPPDCIAAAANDATQVDLGIGAQHG